MLPVTYYVKHKNMSARIREIIQKYIQNNQPKQVQRIFASWINRSANKVEKDEALEEIWTNLNIQADESTEKSYIKLLSAISTPETKTQRKRISFIHKFSRIAAIIMLPLISIGITYLIMKKPLTINNDVRLVECIVPDGEIRTIILPDSSVVKVNSGSILIYPEQFTSGRDIFLNGEAYFTVTKDDTKPFIVKTTDMNVEVLGTIFNVSSYSDSERSSTTLKSGKVKVQLRNTEKFMVLLPNEQITYNRVSGTIEKNTVSVENTIAWTEGNLVIQGMSIEEVVKVIERKYMMNVYLNSSKYKDERISMKIMHGEDITEFMSVLKYLVPQLKYKVENNKLYIY